MPTGRGDFQGALDVFLSLDLAEVGRDEERFEFIACSLIRLDANGGRKMVRRDRQAI